jgi:DNA-binding response OmpR family regulator
VWQYPAEARPRTGAVHVQRLRRKLGADAAASIKTIVRAGYCWFPDPAVLAAPQAVSRAA